MCNSIIPTDALQTVKFPAQELLPDFSTNRIRQLHSICRHFFIPSLVLLWLVFALPLILYPTLPKLATYLEEKGLGHHYVVQNKNNPEYAATYFGLYVLVPSINFILFIGILPK